MERNTGGEQADKQSQWEQLAAGVEPESYGAEQDIDEIRAVQQMVKKYFEQQRERAPERAREEAHTILNIEQGFIKQQQRDRERGRETSEAEFNEWEQDYARTWKRLQGYLREGNIRGDEEAQLEGEMFFTKDEDVLHETVEAQAGKYYRQRSQMLREAIEKSDSETKDADLEVLSNFYMSVASHLEFKYMTAEDIHYTYGNSEESYKNLDRSRTQAHNAVIQNLNSLNNLANQYGTTPFTPRNFWTSNKTEQNVAESRRMRYDRDVVEEYYSIAFSQKIEEAKRRFERRNRGY